LEEQNRKAQVEEDFKKIETETQEIVKNFFAFLATQP
jgi:hypothetical protein